MMDVEVVDIRKITGSSNLKAFADVKFGGGFVVHGFSVFLGKRGVFVSVPKKAGKEGKWFEVLDFEDDELKLEVQDKILEAYDRETGAR